MLEIDRDGFDQWDKRIIEALIHKFNGGPVGLNSLAVAIGEEAGTLEEVNEPYLIMEGYIKRTPQGRVALPNAYRKLGLKPPVGRAVGVVRELDEMLESRFVSARPPRSSLLPN